MSPEPIASADGGEQFEVALSFAGEQRHYVERVAQELQRQGVKVFYDNDEDMEVYLLGKDLIEEFERIYSRASSTVAMFISEDYVSKDWTRHERRATLTRQIEERREYVLPFRFDNARVPGLPTSTGFISVGDRTPEALAGVIVKKLLAMGARVPTRLATPRVTTTIRSSGVFRVTVNDLDGTPIDEAQVVAVSENGIAWETLTNHLGKAEMRIPYRRLLHVFAAKQGFQAAWVDDHDPDDDLTFDLPVEADGGSTVINQAGYVPGLDGRFNPIGTSDRSSFVLYVDNMSINDEHEYPFAPAVGEDLLVEDQTGHRATIRFLAFAGTRFLLQYRHEPDASVIE